MKVFFFTKSEDLKLLLRFSGMLRPFKTFFFSDKIKKLQSQENYL